MQTNPLAAALSSVHIGVPVTIDNLTMIPLLGRGPRESSLDYVVLDDALASGEVEITEVSEQGSVPNLRVVNRGPRPVFILDGEELLGAKQNRVVNLTILVAAHTELTIPVSCVEAGRWRARSRSFTSAPRTQYSSGRAQRMKDVSHSMKVSGDRVSNQTAVWDNIAEKSMRMKATSPTSAMQAMYDVHERSLTSFVDGMPAADEQIGAAFAIGSRVIGFDLFDRPTTLRRLLPKLVRSAAIDAIDAPPPDSRQQDATGLVQEATQFLALTAAAERHVTGGLGLGDDVRLSAPRMAGAALVVGADTAHVGAFAI